LSDLPSRGIHSVCESEQQLIRTFILHAVVMVNCFKSCGMVFRSTCRDETLKCSELTVKLEPAFLAGLRCVQPAIRAKFFEVFDASMKRRLHDRLMYITCSQNWEAMGPHYWIKQCIELLVVTASSSKTSCYTMGK
jgi:hypothetical protein